MSCVQQENAQKESKAKIEINNIKWYILQDGIFVLVDDIASIDNMSSKNNLTPVDNSYESGGSLKISYDSNDSGCISRSSNTRLYIPWTVQQRVSDIISFKNTIFIAVNGYGIVRLACEAWPSFIYYYEPYTFKYKTITHLFSLDDSILCHFYFNTLLNIKSKKYLENRGIKINLLKYSTNERGHQITYISPPYQEDNPEWELINILPSKENYFYLEWKYSGQDITDFRYSRFDLSTNKEYSLTKESFRKAYNFEHIKDARGERGLYALIEDVIKRVEGKDEIHFLLKTDDSSFIRRFRYINSDLPSDANSVDISIIKFFKEGSSYYALHPHEEIIWTKDIGNGEIEKGIIKLPSLPHGFVYTDLFIKEDYFIFSWEEVDFINVYSAGLLILDVI